MFNIRADRGRAVQGTSLDGSAAVYCSCNPLSLCRGRGRFREATHPATAPPAGGAVLEGCAHGRQGSMGPQHFGCGRLFGDQHGLQRPNASIGPRPDGCGMDADGDQHPDHRNASTGPRHDGRGGGNENDHAADNHLASMGPRPGGRGRCDKDYHAANDDLASMGPRPGGRGRTVPCALLSSVPVPRIFLPPPVMAIRLPLEPPPCGTIVALQSRCAS